MKKSKDVNNLCAPVAWQAAYNIFRRILQERGLESGVELGVAYGGNSASILSIDNVTKLYGVDPYLHMDGYDDPMNLPQQEFDKLYVSVLKRLDDKRYTHIRKTSKEAVNDVPGQVDFIFIDADHSYEGVKEDIEIWFSKVRIGGIISGHDYGHVNFPGVKKAVHEFFDVFGWQVHDEGEGVWWVEKKSDAAISFIMPCYNCADTVAVAVESIFEQGFDVPFEVICTDDASTDGTLAVLNDCAAYHSEITVLTHKKNKGGAAARNTCVRASKGGLIFCLDSDNILAPKSVSLLINALRDSGCDAASFAEIRYFQLENSKFDQKHSWFYEAKNNICDLSHIISTVKTPPASGNYLFTRESFDRAGGYPEGRGAMDAWGFGFRQLATGSKIAVVPDTYYWHRLSTDSYWIRDQKQGLNSKNALSVIKEFIELFDEKTKQLLNSQQSEEDLFALIDKARLSLKNNEPKIKLHLGCGQTYLNGYVNIDYPASEHTVQIKQVADKFADITQLDYPPQSVDEVRLHHVFEHFSTAQALGLLCCWAGWLKTGGRLHLETPDVMACAQMLVDENTSYTDKQVVLRHMFGSHEAHWAVHKDGWYAGKFEYVLKELGFSDVKITLSEWLATKNITVMAVKSETILPEDLCKKAHVLLRDAMVSQGGSEEELWKVWCGIFDKQAGFKSDAESAHRVSIFMPVYNNEKYLPATIESLLEQKFTDFELIIADDGSEDKSLEIARIYEKKDKRIKVIAMPHRGEVVTRNEALKHTDPCSKYLLNHDSDDISLPDKLSELVAFLEAHPDIAIVGCLAVYFNSENKITGKPEIECHPDRIRATFAQKNSMINSASMIRRKVFDTIGGYREEFRSVDDYDFYARALLAGFKMANITMPLHLIRIHEASVSATRAETQRTLEKRIQDYYTKFTSGGFVALNPLTRKDKYLFDIPKEKVNGENLKLHIGCGDVKVKGFINVDADPKLPAVDVVDDVRTLSRFEAGSAEVIYACHVLEHLSHGEVFSVLTRWYDVLKSGGELRISVPDTDRIVQIYQKHWEHFQTPPNTPWIGLIYGGELDEYDYHKTGFNFCYLKYILEIIGFITIEEYTHTPHWLGINDASCANWNGDYLSLNVLAVKV